MTVQEISALPLERQEQLFDIYMSLQRDPTGSQWTGAAIAESIMLNAAARVPAKKPSTTIQPASVSEPATRPETSRSRRTRPARLILGLRGAMQPA